MWWAMTGSDIEAIYTGSVLSTLFVNYVCAEPVAHRIESFMSQSLRGTVIYVACQIFKFDQRQP